MRVLVLFTMMALNAAAGTALALGEGSKPFALRPTEEIMPKVGDLVDAAPFGEVRVWPDGHNLGILWEDPRDVFKVVVRFRDAQGLPDPSKVKLQYWVSGGWPENRLPRESIAAVSGWLGTGDWFNGEWRDADITLLTDGPVWAYIFKPANEREFPSVEDFAGTYRTTRKIRLTFPGEIPTVASLSAFTDSIWVETSFVVEWKGGLDDPVPLPRFEAFNGYCAGSSPVSVLYARPQAAFSGDATVVTVRRGDHSFSLDPSEIARGGEIFIPDLGAFVRSAGSARRYAQAEAEHGKNERCRYDLVASLPEQTFPQAWSAMPAKGRITMPLACEGGRQHFGITPLGHVLISKIWQERVPGPDSAKCKWQGENLNIGVGFPESPNTGAYLEDGDLPVPVTWHEKDGVRYLEEAFATTLSGKLPPGGRVRADEPQVLMLRFRLTNTTDKPALASFPIVIWDGGGTEQIVERGGLVYGRRDDQEYVRLYVTTNRCADLSPEHDKLVCNVRLSPRSAAEFYAAIPFQTVESPAETTMLRALDYKAQHAMITGYWRERLDQGCRIITPEPYINEFFSAYTSHALINAENEVGSNDRVMAKVGTFHYGVFTNESVMMVVDLDRRGFHDIARRAYDMWLRYQGTVGLPGDYLTKDGVLYGAGGYEAGGYNQHHGWALWGIGEHYWFTRDSQWLRKAAPKIVKACEWIINERARTKTDEFAGIRAIESGLLPPGSLEDIGDWRCWLSNNVMSYWGMHSAAMALAAIGNPEGDRLLKEAEAYKQDIRKAFLEAMVRAPVQRLRDGSYVPMVPSDVHRRGRSVGWITEVLEGAIHLIRCGIVDPNEPVAAWIMKDYEDNRYLVPPYGYGIPCEERDWFSLGGFCQQPSLLCSPTPYLMRDEPKHYLRSYFNAFSAGYFPQRAMLTEHPLPNLGDAAGDQFKSSDEGMNSSWIRWMFIWDEGEDLSLGMMMPRYWLSDGKRVSIDRAATHFGPMSVSITSRAAKGSIEMTIVPPVRNQPRTTYARFRHPEGKTMNRVTVNGRPWSKFDPAKEWVVLPPLRDKTVVTAWYD